MLNDYIILKTLGKGRFGKVKLAIRRNKGKVKKFAIKILKKKFLLRRREVCKGKEGKLIFSTCLDQVKSEIGIMKTLNHPNIVKLYEVIESEDSEKIFMVMEFAEGGSIIQWVQAEKRFIINSSQNNGFSEEEIRSYFRDLLRAINYRSTSFN